MTTMKLLTTCLCSVLALSLVADETPVESAEKPTEAPAGGTQAQGRVKQPYSRYESIVERQMFGPLPPGFDPEKMPNEVSKSEQKELTKEQEKLQSSIHFSMINVTPDGNTVVGFTDNSDPKVPVPMYLKVGESRNGWTVLEADPKAATMRISKGDIEVSLTIGGNSAGDGAATSKSKATAPVAAGGGRPRFGGPAGAGLLGSNSLRARRARRDAERQQAAEDEAKRQAEEKAAREEEKAQREAEREEQRRALESLRDELKKQREEAAKAREEAKAASGSDQEGSDENNAAE